MSDQQIRLLICIVEHPTVRVVTQTAIIYVDARFVMHAEFLGFQASQGLLRKLYLHLSNDTHHCYVCYFTLVLMELSYVDHLIRSENTSYVQQIFT